MFESLSPPKDPLLLSVWGFVSPPLGGIRPVLHHAHPVRTMAPNSPAEKGKEEEQDGEKEQQRVYGSGTETYKNSLRLGDFIGPWKYFKLDPKQTLMCSQKY